MTANDWLAAFDDATEALTTSLYSGAIPTKAERAASAHKFQSYIDQFKSGGKPAQTFLRTALEISNSNRFLAALRLSIECGDTESLQELSGSITRFGNGVPPNDLKRLWIKSPPTEQLNELLKRLAPHHYGAAIEAILARPTPEAYALFEELNRHNDYVKVGYALKAIARWNDSALLEHVMNTYTASDALLARGLGWDIRAEAAFNLGLTGNSSGIAYLNTLATGTNLKQAVDACYHLSQLALPDAVAATIRTLEGDDDEAIATAISIAGDLGLPAFIPALCTIAEQKFAPFGSETPSYDEAIRVIREIIGQPLDDLEEEYREPEPDDEIFYGEGEFSEAYRSKAVAIARTALQAMNPVQRYDYGEPLTLAHLASDLLSPHAGPSYRAAHNLRAITGEDYGFDPDDDLIANMAAVDLWQQRARRPEPLASGGWAFQGKPLPPPELS